MLADSLVLRTVYLDPDVDERLRVDAAAQNMSKGDLFRRCLALGVKAASANPSLGKARLGGAVSAPLVLRTVYLDPKLDDRLRVQAFDAGERQSELVRRYVRLGMSATAAP